jgi:hypothetical protein
LVECGASLFRGESRMLVRHWFVKRVNMPVSVGPGAMWPLMNEAASDARKTSDMEEEDGPPSRTPPPLRGLCPRGLQ